MLKICLETTVVLTWLILTLKAYVVKRGVKNLTIYVLIWLKTKIKVIIDIFVEGKATYNESTPETEAS